MRRALQIVLAVLGLIPIATGLMDILVGTALLPGSPEVPAAVDSNYRFFATMWLFVGLTIMWSVPRVERATGPLRVLFAAVFVGGLARLWSLVVVGTPPPFLVFFIGLELVAPPILWLWQARVARSSPS